jgi:hypothetical protein
MTFSGRMKKMKTEKKFLNMDERNKLIAYKVISKMYFLTILALQGVIMYRQFALGQSYHDFEDMAVILTVNSLFLITALLYFGAIPLRKIRIKFILAGYAVIIVAGSIFTYIKYNVFGEENLTVPQMMDKFIIIIIISGLIVLFWVIFSILGKRRQESDLEEE